MTRARGVVDTNVLVSRLILPQSLPAHAVRSAEREAILLISAVTMYEPADVLARPKFDPYISLEDRKRLLQRLSYIAEIVLIIQLVGNAGTRKTTNSCVARNGGADLIMKGVRIS